MYIYPDNLKVNDYFSVALTQCSKGEQIIGTITDEAIFYENLSVNSIPHNVVNMTASDYPSFLLERRKQMAQRIKAYYSAL